MNLAMPILHSACAVLVWVAVVTMVETRFGHVLAAGASERLRRAIQPLFVGS